MNKDFWTAAGLIFGAIVSAPFLIASLRAFFFFGQMSQAVKTVEAAIKRVEDTATAFMKKVDEDHTDHEKRITENEVEIRNLRDQALRLRDD